MTTPAAAHNAFSGAQDAGATCQHRPCGKSFQPRRSWQTFCSATCRTSHHAAENRKKVIRLAELDLFEALRRIAAGELTEGETPAGVATSAIKDLRAP